MERKGGNVSVVKWQLKKINNNEKEKTRGEPSCQERQVQAWCVVRTQFRGARAPSFMARKANTMHGKTLEPTATVELNFLGKGGEGQKQRQKFQVFSF